MRGHVYLNMDSSLGWWIQTPGYKNNNDTPLRTLRSPWEKGKNKSFSQGLFHCLLSHTHAAWTMLNVLLVSRPREHRTLTLPLKRKKMMHNALLFIAVSLFYSRIKLKVVTLNKIDFTLKLSKILAWIWMLKVNSIWIVILCEVCCYSSFLSFSMYWANVSSSGKSWWDECELNFTFLSMIFSFCETRLSKPSTTTQKGQVIESASEWSQQWPSRRWWL